jgi:hypothetical protein
MFTVKSIYSHIIRDGQGPYMKHIWKSKIPSKIKVLCGFCDWNGDTSCCFCDHMECVEHLFFKCLISRVIWDVVAKCLNSSNIPGDIKQCWR